MELVVWSMPGMDMIIGLPDITNHFRDKLVQMISNMELTTEMAAGDLVKGRRASSKRPRRSCRQRFHVLSRRR